MVITDEFYLKMLSDLNAGVYHDQKMEDKLKAYATVQSSTVVPLMVIEGFDGGSQFKAVCKQLKPVAILFSPKAYVPVRKFGREHIKVLNGFLYRAGGDTIGREAELKPSDIPLYIGSFLPADAPKDILFVLPSGQVIGYKSA